MTGSRGGRGVGMNEGNAVAGIVDRYSATKPFFSSESSVFNTNNNHLPVDTNVGGSCNHNYNNENEFMIIISSRVIT